MPEDEDEPFTFDESVDAAVVTLRAFIDTEQQFVKGEHELKAKLDSWDYIIMHLLQEIPESMPHLHDLNTEIGNKLFDIRALIESDSLKDVRIMKEEQQHLDTLEETVRHRNYRAVRRAVRVVFAAETKDEDKVLRLEIHELQKLHAEFAELMQIMKKSNLVSALNEDMTTPKQKHEYETVEEHYFVEIYKFARAYERIFRDLIQKERRLFAKVRNNSNRIK